MGIVAWSVHGLGFRGGGVLGFMAAGVLVLGPVGGWELGAARGMLWYQAEPANRSPEALKHC